jgi:GMP synthase (glutamine-hydrolysing)
MQIEEIEVKDLDAQKFVEEKVAEIASIVGTGLAVNAMLGHKALGERLKTYFIDHGLMREGEPQRVVLLFNEMGVPVELVEAQGTFFDALKGVEDPEAKREGITNAFYKEIFSHLVKESGATHLLQGTNYTDIEETVAGVKRQHNILEQLGIDTEKEYGYKVIEPLIQLRKPAVREVAKALGLLEEIYNRPPFPGPALATRVIGEVTPERVKIVRKATRIVEEILSGTQAFQYLAILHQDRVTGVREGQRDYGFQIEVRCWDSTDAKTGSPTELPYEILEELAERITTEVPGVVSVTYNITKKPPSTIEAV